MKCADRGREDVTGFIEKVYLDVRHSTVYVGKCEERCKPGMKVTPHTWQWLSTIFVCASIYTCQSFRKNSSNHCRPVLARRLGCDYTSDPEVCRPSLSRR